jgi:AbrB family looped-hinge helix DNA binding protein
MNAQTRLSAKGQVVIPKPLRDHLRWAEGDELEVIETGDGILLRRKADKRRSITIKEFMAEMPTHDGPPASLKEMNGAIERAREDRWAAKEARSR